MIRQEIQETWEIIECALQTPIEVCEANKGKYKKICPEHTCVICDRKRNFEIIKQKLRKEPLQWIE